MQEQTETFVIETKLNEFLDKEYSVKHEQARYMACNARTSIMMFKATKDTRYLDRAKKEIQQGKDILNGFVRPLGVILHQS